MIMRGMRRLKITKQIYPCGRNIQDRHRPIAIISLFLPQDRVRFFFGIVVVLTFFFVIVVVVLTFHLPFRVTVIFVGLLLLLLRKRSASKMCKFFLLSD